MQLMKDFASKGNVVENMEILNISDVGKRDHTARANLYYIQWTQYQKLRGFTLLH